MKFLQECIQHDIITSVHIKAAQNTAAILTKQLAAVIFKIHPDYSLGNSREDLPVLNAAMCGYYLVTHSDSSGQTMSQKQRRTVKLCVDIECDKVNRQSAT